MCDLGLMRVLWYICTLVGKTSLMLCHEILQLRGVKHFESYITNRILKLVGENISFIHCAHNWSYLLFISKHSVWNDCSYYDLSLAFSLFLPLAVPYVNKFEKSKNLVQGDTLTLRCDAFGYPAPYAMWFRDEEPLLASDERVTLENYESTS